MKIAITGHRPKNLGNDYDLTSPLLLAIKAKLQAIIDEYKPELLISGMALGIDTLWAKMAIENNIKLLAAVPCLDQDILWQNRQRSLYHSILSNPLTTKILVTNEPYSAKCMDLRNKFMVDECDILTAVWDNSESGGTYNCVKYAKSVGRTIIQVNPKEIN